MCKATREDSQGSSSAPSSSPSASPAPDLFKRGGAGRASEQLWIRVRPSIQTGAFVVLVHSLVPHGVLSRDEGRPAGGTAGARHATRHDDVLQQVLEPSRTLLRLGHVGPPGPAATPHRWPDGDLWLHLPTPE